MTAPSRRALLKALAAAAALRPAVSLGGRARRGVVIGSLRGVDRRRDVPVYAVVLIDLDTQKRRTVTLDFFAHGFALDPRSRRRALLFEKKGPGACEVDLVTGERLRPLKTSAERAFYGHGAFSRDGATLFVAENTLQTRQGLVSIWDGVTLAPLGEFPTYGQNPHDCQLIDGGKTLVVTNGGGAFPEGDAPCVTFIDIATRKLLEKVSPDSARINAGHVAISRKRAVALISAPRDGLPKTDPGAVSLRDVKGPLVTLTEPAGVTGAMRGETLSLSLHEPLSRLATTNPDGNQLAFWDVRSHALLKAVTLESARGVTQTLDGAYFVVSHGATATLSLFSTRTLEEDPKLAVVETGFAGSHLYTWDGVIA